MTKLDVITGFLGAGKTTLLSRYTRWLERENISYRVIENEFGSAGVDGSFLKEQGAAVQEISGGCVCCTLKVTLHNMLLELSDRVERILLEPSGLFCGDDLMDILESPGLRDQIQLGVWCVVVDPLAIPAMGEEDLAVLYSEAVDAGSAVLSKTQLASGAECAEALALLRRLLPEPAPALWADPWDELADDVWFPALQSAGAVKRPHERRRFDHAAMFQSASFAPRRLFFKEELRERLASVMDGRAGAVLRVKGVLSSAEGASFRVNCTPGSEWLIRSTDRAEPMLNVIGRDLDRAAIKKLLCD